MVTADLNPPLGKPGGPCQVVDRIVKRVRDERLQKGLVNEVQKGEDLSNAEASKVYPIEAEPGVGPIHKIVITSHGQYRMDLREITVDDVRGALASFVKQLENWRALKSPAYDTFMGRLEGKEHVEWVDPRSKLKVVFAQESPGTVRLITTFWRGQQSAPPPKGTCKIPGKAAMDPLVLRVAARFQRQAAVPKGAKKVFLDAVREQVSLARVVWGQLRDSSKAALVAVRVLAESNAREEANITEHVLHPIIRNDMEDARDIPEHAHQVASQLHWDIVESAAFAVALLEAAGQAALAKKLFNALLAEVGQYL